MVIGLRLGLPKQEAYAINTLGEIEDMLSAAAPSFGGKGPLPAVEVCRLYPAWQAFLVSSELLVSEPFPTLYRVCPLRRHRFEAFLEP
jgi:hypothetical protein